MLTGTSYAVMMIDLDIPTNGTTTDTLLHWMQTGLTPGMTATQLNMTSGSKSVFLLQNTGNTPALATYIGPSPPARKPLSHRYTQILVDTSGVTTQSTSTLQMAAMTRRGFNAQMVLQQAGLQNRVVAGNFFVVMNPGPAQDNNGDSASNTTTGGSGSMTGSGSGTSSSSTPSSSSVVVSEAGLIDQPSVAFFALLVAGAVFLGL